jgi:uroporphyrinogen III methyltransferase/synthase
MPIIPRVLITREEPAPLVEAVSLAGGDPILLPLLATRWLPFEIPAGRSLDEYDWVAFTSVRAFQALAGAVEKHGWSWPPDARAAAVGGRTAHELQAQGWMPECIADDSSALGLATSMSAHGVLGARILFPCSAIAETTLPDGLRAAGATVDVLPVYTTETPWSQAPEQLPLLGRELRVALERGCVATCASPSAARALAELASAAGVIERLRRTPIVALGPTTGAEVEALGLRAIDAGGRTLACLARKAVEVGRAQ